MKRETSIRAGRRFLRQWMATAGISASLLGVLLISAGGAADWSTYRWDMARSGVTSEDLPHALSLQWTYRPLQAPKPAWPAPSEELPRMHSDNAYHVAISQGLVYFGSSVDDKVWAVDAATGDVRWSFCAEGPVRFAPTVCAGRVYFGSDDGHVYCLDAADGRLIWRRRAGPSDEKVIGNGRMISLWPVRTSVLVDNGVVHFAAGVFPYEGLYVYVAQRRGRLRGVGQRHDRRPCARTGVRRDVSARLPGRFLEDPLRAIRPGDAGRLRPGHRQVSLLRVARCKTRRHVGLAGRQPLDCRSRLLGYSEQGHLRRRFRSTTGGCLRVVCGNRHGGDLRSRLPGQQRRRLRSRSRGLYVRRGGRQEAGRRAAGVGETTRRVEEETDCGRQQTGTEDLTKQIEEQTQKLNEVVAKRRNSRIPCISGVYSGRQFTVRDSRRGCSVGGRRWSGCRAGRIQRKRGVASRCRWTGRRVGRCRRTTGREHRHGLRPLLWRRGGATAKTFGDSHVANPYPDDELTETYAAAARKIIEATGVLKGYCLVLDCGEGRLAYELARQTDLQIVGLEQDPGKLAVARSRLQDAGLWGSRVVVEPWDVQTLPDYFANLIVSDGMLRTGETAASREERQSGPETLGRNGVSELSRIRTGGLEAVRHAVRWRVPAAGRISLPIRTTRRVPWTSWSTGRLEFSGLANRVRREWSNVTPACRPPWRLAGRLFIQGENNIRAVDAFNGTLLWQRDIPGAVRVLVKADAGNLVVTDTGLYVAALDKCYRLDPATGQTVRVYEMPASAPGQRRRWGYVSVVGNVLYGSTATAMKYEYGAVLASFLANGQWRPAAEVPAEFRDEYEKLKKLYPDPQGSANGRSARRLHVQSHGPTFPEAGEFTQKNATTKNLMVSDKVFAVDTETGATALGVCRTANRQHHVGPG